MRFFIIALIVLSLGLPVAAPASAQQVDFTNQTATPDERVNIQMGEITVKDWTYTDGKFRIKVTAEFPTTMVVADQMAVARALEAGSGGSVKIPKRAYDLNAGSQTIVFPARTYKGEAAASIANNAGSYLIYTGSTSSGWSGPWTTRHLQIVGLAAAISVALVVIVKTIRHFTGRSHAPERVA